MKTENFKYLGYFQTGGSPVCITQKAHLQNWQGAEISDGLYWKMLENVDSNKIIDIFNQDYLIFNSETGNFFIFEFNNNLIIVEAIYLEEDFSIGSSGISFEIHEKNDLDINFNESIAIFDSALTIYEKNKFDSFHKIGNTDFFNFAQLMCIGNEVHTVSYKNKSVHFLGIKIS